MNTVDQKRGSFPRVVFFLGLLDSDVLDTVLCLPLSRDINLGDLYPDCSSDGLHLFRGQNYSYCNVFVFALFPFLCYFIVDIHSYINAMNASY